MPDNKQFAERIGVLAPNSDVNEVVREVNLSDLGEAFKEFPSLKVRVNPPAIWDAMVRSMVGEQKLERTEIIRIVNIFTDIPADDLDKWLDQLLYIVYARARDAYWEYWGELRKNSPAQ